MDSPIARMRVRMFNSITQGPGAQASSSLPLIGQLRLTAEAITVAYLGLLSWVASLTGIVYIFFPELGALTLDVLSKPRGKWSSAPLSLSVTPAVTAAIGVACIRNVDYGIGSMLLVTGLCIAAVRLLRSPIAPAISAGVLPVVMGITSWWYPPAILLGTSFLAVCSRPWAGMFPTVHEPEPGGGSRAATTLAPSFGMWAAALAFVLVVGGQLVVVFDQRLILFPPLVVIAFEMFTHPDTCPWAAHPARLPVACALSALAGFLLLSGLGAGVLSTMGSVGLAIVILRTMRLHLPPAVAVALIPQIAEAPDWRYPVAVAGGSSLVAITFIAYRRLLERPRRDTGQAAELCPKSGNNR